MYQSTGIIPDASDEIYASLDGTPIYVVIVASGDGVGQVALHIPLERGLPNGIKFIDRLIHALYECKGELNRRAGITPAAPHHDFAAKPISFSLAGAGDPEGMSPDAPEADQ